MKTIFALATLLVLTIPATVSANEPQSGTGGECVNTLITFFQSNGADLGLSTVSVAPGTAYAVSASTGIVYVDFFNSAGQWVGWNGGSEGGVVPVSAAWGAVCAPLLTDPLLGAGLVADPLATWTYQDGL